MSRDEQHVRPTTRRDLVVAELDGELVVFDPVASRVHELDRLGSVIWQFLDGTATVEELARDLSEAFSQPLEVVRSDLDALVDALGAHQLLEDTSPPMPEPSAEPPTPGYLTDPPSP